MGFVERELVKNQFQQLTIEHLGHFFSRYIWVKRAENNYYA